MLIKCKRSEILVAALGLIMHYNYLWTDLHHPETIWYTADSYPLGCPVYLSHKMVTLFTEPQPWKWASSSSAVAP